MSEFKSKLIVQEASRKHRAQFDLVPTGFEDRGILNSEMLAVCSVAEELGVEVFIESGRWRGQSTEILAHYFQDKPVCIESIEIFRDENALYVEQKMKGFSNLHLHYGDANWLIPQLVKKHKGKKIAILFDGPKGQMALDIFRLALVHSDKVVAGFFHDMRKPSPEMLNGSRAEMEVIFPEAFYTDDSDFVSEFQALDKGCEVALWKPYSIDNKPIGSYGPTIGVILPSGQDRELALQERLNLTFKAYKGTLLSCAVKIYHRVKSFFGLKV